MTSIFVNIPTTDLERSKAFYTALGAGINPLFTDENAACIVWDENVFFMVLTKEYFATFTDKQIIDPKTHAQARIALSRDSREDVDEVLAAGLADGGTEPQAGAGLRLHVHAATWKTRTATSSGSCTWSPRRPSRAPRPTWRSRAAPSRPEPWPSRSYGQYCGVTTAVELIGERWAMLIVRDLLVGPRRYTDLKQGLPKIPTNILSDAAQGAAGGRRRPPRAR